jgi:hypothetical protein
MQTYQSRIRQQRRTGILPATPAFAAGIVVGMLIALVAI